jgi:arylsulfatase A
LLEMTGIKAEQEQKASLDGQSFAPLLKDPNASLDREALYFHYPHYYPTTTPVSAVRAGDWKLLEYHEDNRLELYNLRKDLAETNNLVSSEREKASDLRTRLSKWRSEVGAKMPTKNAL